MTVVDSCGWIEYFTGSKYSDFYAPVIEKIDSVIVPTICLMEVSKKICKDLDEDSAMTAIAHMKLGKVVPLTESIALAASILGAEKNLPMADSIIYATAIISNAVIYTQDNHFRSLPRTRFFDI